MGREMSNKTENSGIKLQILTDLKAKIETCKAWVMCNKEELLPPHPETPAHSNFTT